MKRRSFLRGAASLAAAPLLPVPSLAAPSGLPPQLVLLSEHHAARFGTASASLFARRMGISHAKASALADRLVERGLAIASQEFMPKPYSPQSVSRLKDGLQKLTELTKRPPPIGEGLELETEPNSVDLGEQAVE